MASMAVCSQLLSVAPGEIASSSRAAPSRGKACPIRFGLQVVEERNLVLSSKVSYRGKQLAVSRGSRFALVRHGVIKVRAYESSSETVGQDPGWEESDYVVVGLAHCFSKDENQKLVDTFVIEPIPAGGLECMENGGKTCYLHATGTTLGVALKQNISLLPKEFLHSRFCEDFLFRTKCASRTWKRDHAREYLMELVPSDGNVRSDWNFCLEEKRILNQENIVSDSDNIKQDMSIDVYGRVEKEEEMKAEIGQLYNV